MTPCKIRIHGLIRKHIHLTNIDTLSYNLIKFLHRFLYINISSACVDAGAILAFGWGLYGQVRVIMWLHASTLIGLIIYVFLLDIIFFAKLNFMFHLKFVMLIIYIHNWEDMSKICSILWCWLDYSTNSTSSSKNYKHFVNLEIKLGCDLLKFPRYL